MIVIVTSCTRGREQHLLNQHLSLQKHCPDIMHIVITVGGDPWQPWEGANTAHIFDDGPFNLSKARNMGARLAADVGATKIIYLDADCLVDANTIPRMSEAMDHDDTGVYGGGGVWMPAPGEGGYDVESIEGMWVREPDRPFPADGELMQLRPHDAWMLFGLSFGLTIKAWKAAEKFGGFCEEFEGWGFEDTDFSNMLLKNGIPIYLVGGSYAYHQHHQTIWPPVNHLHAVVHNANVFFSRHPEGRIWILREFELLGLIETDSGKNPRIIKEPPEDVTELIGVTVS